MNPVKIKYQLCLLLMIIFIACNTSGNKTNFPVDTLPLPSVAAADSDKIILPVRNKGDILDTLNALSFVQEANRHLDSVTGGKNSIAYIIDTANDTYNITAGYNGAERFETYFLFSVDKNTRAIKVEDVISGALLTPEAFEKRRRLKQ